MPLRSGNKAKWGLNVENAPKVTNSHIASTAIERGFPSCFQNGPYIPEGPKNKKVRAI
jgi:hypothetical protein